MTMNDESVRRLKSVTLLLTVHTGPSISCANPAINHRLLSNVPDGTDKPSNFSNASKSIHQNVLMLRQRRYMLRSAVSAAFAVCAVKSSACRGCACPRVGHDA